MKRSAWSFGFLSILYSITRGINRFKGLALALAEVEKRGLGNIEGLAEYEAWTKEAKELSNPGAACGDAEE